MKKIIVTALCLTLIPTSAFAGYEEERFIEIFAKAYGQALSDYLIERYRRRYGDYGSGVTWSGYRTYNVPGLFPEMSERRVSASELNGLSKSALWVMRNEVYARHGRPFSNSTVRRYFNAQPWYSVDPSYRVPADDVSRLSSTEKLNVALVAKYEKTAPKNFSYAKSSNASQSSYWYKNIRLNESHLRGKSAWDLLVMRNQIVARHGRSFSYKPLQNYFNAQSWYRVNRSYSDGMLTAIEKYNMETILKYEKKMGYM